MADLSGAHLADRALDRAPLRHRDRVASHPVTHRGSLVGRHRPAPAGKRSARTFVPYHEVSLLSGRIVVSFRSQQPKPNLRSNDAAIPDLPVDTGISA